MGGWGGGGGYLRMITTTIERIAFCDLIYNWLRPSVG